MARKLRIEYGGAIYHIMSRGDRGEDIFRGDEDRGMFLQTLSEVCIKTGWQVHALCLMSNHFHLVVETPQPDLVSGMKWFLGTYTGRFNRRHGLCGHLFSGRYKALFVDGSGNGYLKTVCDYVHLNPARARLLRPEQALAEFKWSSFGEYLKATRDRWPWLRVDRLLGEHGIPKDSPAGRKEFETRVESRRAAENENEFQDVKRGWCLGSEEFRKELLAQMSGQARAEHSGPEIRESAGQKAEGIVMDELKKLGWREAELAQRRKGDAEKVRMALRLRNETTMTLTWIAHKLQMGTKTHLSHLLYWAGSKAKPRAIEKVNDTKN